MADLQSKPKSRMTRIAIYAILYLWTLSHHPLVASLVVSLVAWFLASAGIGLQYVVGALLVVFARRFAQKRLAPQVVVDKDASDRMRKFFGKHFPDDPRLKGPDLTNSA